MFQIALSQMTTNRWELSKELPYYANHGFSSVALWRNKVSDFTREEIRQLFEEYSMHVSSVQWAGGFTGSDGRTFEESLADAKDAIHLAASLKCPTVVLYSGSRGGHTLSHARRLLTDAIETLIPIANQENVQLALKPLHPHATSGCSFLTTLTDTLVLIDQVNEYSLPNTPVGMSVDLWHFADDPHLLDNLQ
ncbi:MAG: sugar phosphate isomerase/epimerase family protein, partial [Pirellulales bacterium]